MPLNKNTDNRYEILNTYVNAISMDETIRRVEEIIKRGIPTQHVVINASKVNLMEKDLKLRKIVNACPLINADGASIVWAAKKLGVPLKERVTGIDLFQRLVELSDVYIVSVPTPYDKFSKKVDACYVVEAVKDVMKVCHKGATVVIESTVSPGTIDKFVRPVIEENGFTIGQDINLVHAPERIIPGNMVYELLHNNRTIGADDKAVGEKVKELYSSFCQGDIVVTDIRTAEMTKVVENTFRAVNIAFANELAKICRHDNMDVYEIIKICNMHPRVNILQPGPGVGGHCISVDPWFLVGDYPSLAKGIRKSYPKRRMKNFLSA